jgi:predicted Zn-dependent protease
MLNLLGPYKYVVDIVAIGLLVALCAFGVHRYNAFQQGVGEARIQAQWDKANEVAKDAQRLREIQLQKEKDDAVAQAAKNVQSANAAAASAAASGRVLQSTIQTILARSSGDNVEANRKYTAALAAVFADCRDKYQELGREAQGHADDSLMYQNAWPK